MTLEELRALTRTAQWRFLTDNMSGPTGLREVALVDGVVLRRRMERRRSNTGKTTFTTYIWEGPGFCLGRQAATGAGWHGGYGSTLWCFTTPAHSSSPDAVDYSKSADCTDDELRERGYKFRATPEGCYKL